MLLAGTEIETARTKLLHKVAVGNSTLPDLIFRYLLTAALVFIRIPGFLKQSRSLGLLHRTKDEMKYEHTFIYFNVIYFAILWPNLFHVGLSQLCFCSLTLPVDYIVQKGFGNCEIICGLNYCRIKC